MVWLDVSEIYRPEGKDKENFRVFQRNDADPIMKRVYQTYMDMHANQTMDFVHQKVC